MEPFREFDDVVLWLDPPNMELDNGGRGLVAGDEGTLVDLSPDGTGGVVEFFRDGESVAVIGVPFVFLALAPVTVPTPARDAH